MPAAKPIEIRRQARVLYSEGKTTVEVGTILSVHHTSVARWCKDILRPNIGPNRKTYKPLFTSGGYIYICISGKYVPEHRFKMEQHLGRKLQPNEVVHHINKNSTDNNITNLELVSRGEHRAKHIGDKYKPPNKDKYCVICGKKLHGKETTYPSEWEDRKSCSKSCSAKLRRSYRGKVVKRFQ